MKVALVQCPQWDLELPPLGIAYLSSYIKKNDHKVKIFDFNIDLFHEVGEKYKKYWEVGFDFDIFWREREKMEELNLINKSILDMWLEKIMKFEPDVIGFSMLVNTKLVSLILAEKIKEINPDIKIIFGGQECLKDRSGFEIVNKNFIDVVVQGEGEYTLNEVINKMKNNEEIEKVSGILMKKNDKVIDNGTSIVIKNLDQIPFPDFGMFNLEKYLRSNALPLLMSRGCVNRCVYCSERIFWQQYRCRSAENVFEEMKHNIKRFNRRVFFFNDSLINGNLKELEILCDLIIESGLETVWNGNAIIRKDMSLKLLQKMKKAGCDGLVYGIESASEKILRKMGRNYNVKDAERVIKDTAKVGIVPATNWILGFPGETNIDFMKTIWFLIKNRKYLKITRPGGSPFVVLASTDIYKNCKDYDVVPGLNGPDWCSVDGKNTRELREKRANMFRNIARMLRMID